MMNRTLSGLTVLGVVLCSHTALAAPEDPVLHTAMIEVQGASQEHTAPPIFSVPLGGQVDLRIDVPNGAVSAVAESDTLGWHHVRLHRANRGGDTRFSRTLTLSLSDAPGLYHVQVHVTDIHGRTSIHTVLVDVYEDEVGC